MTRREWLASLLGVAAAVRLPGGPVIIAAETTTAWSGHGARFVFSEADEGAILGDLFAIDRARAGDVPGADP